MVEFRPLDIGQRSLRPFVSQAARWGRRLRDCLPDRVILARRYRRTFGRALDLRNPQTFNKKLYWLMLYYRPPLATTVSDKYAVRSHVAERVGPEILTELYGVWETGAPSSVKSLSVRARGPASSFHPRTTATGARRSSYRARSGSEINVVAATGPGSA